MYFKTIKSKIQLGFFIYVILFILTTLSLVGFYFFKYQKNILSTQLELSALQFSTKARAKILEKTPTLYNLSKDIRACINFPITKKEINIPKEALAKLQKLFFNFLSGKHHIYQSIALVRFDGTELFKFVENYNIPERELGKYNDINFINEALKNDSTTINLNSSPKIYNDRQILDIAFPVKNSASPVTSKAKTIILVGLYLDNIINYAYYPYLNPKKENVTIAQHFFLINNEGEKLFSTLKNELTNTHIASISSSNQLSKVRTSKSQYFAYKNEIPELGWSVATLVNRNEFYKPLIYQIALTLLLFITFFLIMLLASEKISNTISKPISNLKKQVKEISKGNWLMSVTSSSRDEVGDLANSFEEMRQNIIALKEKAMKHARLAAIGETTTMLAHDIRKPFAKIKSYLEQIPQKKDDSKFLDLVASDLEVSFKQVDNMIQDILDMTSEKQISQKICNLQSLLVSCIRETFTLYSNLDIEIIYNLSHKNNLYIDIIKIIRVFNNVIANAAEAMNKKGKLWFFTKDFDGLLINNEPMIEIIIGNSNSYIPEEEREKIFDPFYTKGDGHGTGLGLSICQKFIELHNGTINVRSDKEKGTEFVLLLPAKVADIEINKEELILSSKEIEDINSTKKSHLDIHTKIKSILEVYNKIDLLIVDDEPLFRESLRFMIGKIDGLKDIIRITETGSGEEALNIFRQRLFQHVIVDIFMGPKNMDGLDFSRRLIKLYPNTNIILHSNKKISNQDLAVLKKEGIKGFLPKPMSTGDFLNYLTEGLPKKNNNGDRANNINVLLIEDDIETILANKAILRETLVLWPGVRKKLFCFEAKNATGANAILKSNRIDIIIANIDLGAAKEEGLKLISDIRRNFPQRDIYVTGSHQKKSIMKKIVTAGGNDYFELPLVAEHTKDILEKCLK